jgi:hypothetical protein
MHDQLQQPNPKRNNFSCVPRFAAAVAFFFARRPRHDDIEYFANISTDADKRQRPTHRKLSESEINDWIRNAQWMFGEYWRLGDEGCLDAFNLIVRRLRERMHGESPHKKFQ